LTESREWEIEVIFNFQFACAYDNISKLLILVNNCVKCLSLTLFGYIVKLWIGLDDYWIIGIV